MTSRILLALVASTAVAIVGAPVAGANPVSAQYDNPSIASPVTENPSIASPVTENPSVTSPVTENPSVTSPVIKVKGTSNTAKTAGTTTEPTPAQVTQPAQVATVSSNGTLPFTGLDLGLFLVIGGVAVASGLGLRRVAARRPENR